MNREYISEGEAIGWIYDDCDLDDDAPLTENQKMLAFHGYDSDDDLSHISRNEWGRMWWAYRNRQRLGLDENGNPTPQ